MIWSSIDRWSMRNRKRSTERVHSATNVRLFMLNNRSINGNLVGSADSVYLQATFVVENVCNFRHLKYQVHRQQQPAFSTSKQFLNKDFNTQIHRNRSIPACSNTISMEPLVAIPTSLHPAMQSRQHAGLGGGKSGTFLHRECCWLQHSPLAHRSKNDPQSK